MNRIVLFLVVIFTVSVCALAEMPPELLLNCGFENGDIENPWDEGRTPYGWFKWSDNWGWAAWKYDAVSRTVQIFICT